MSVNSVQYLQVPPRANPDRVMEGASRELPSRKAMRDSRAFETYAMSPPKTDYQQVLAQTLFPNYSPNAFHYNPSKKYIPQSDKPKWENVIFFKTIHLPNIEDNFYSNNLDWGKQFLAYNEGNTSIIWNPKTEKRVTGFKSDYYHRSIKWAPEGNIFAMGATQGNLVVYDLLSGRFLFDDCIYDDSDDLNEEFTSVGAIDWRSQRECMLTTAGKILCYDTRSKTVSWQFRSCDERVLSLECSPNDRLLATGCAHGKVNIYDIRNTSRSLFSYSHEASVKALKWVPNSSVLLSGGGTNNRHIVLFDVKQEKFLSEVDTRGQVASIEYLGDNEFVSSSADFSNTPINHILFWKWDEDFNIKKTNRIGFQQRVFNVSKNPNALEFCSISSGECVQLWKPGLQKIPPNPGFRPNSIR